MSTKITTQQWKRIGLIAAFISAAIGAFGGALTIYDWLKKPAPDLVAEVSTGPFVLPPQFEDVINANRKLADGDWVSGTLRSAFAELGVPPKDVERLVLNATFAIRDQLREKVPREFAGGAARYQGYWFAKVRNGGTQLVEGVRITFPFAKAAVMRREGLAPIFRDGGPAFDLGTIHPGEEVQLVGWTSIEPTEFAARSINLSHLTGQGTVKFERSVGRVAHFLDENWLNLFLVLNGVVLVVIVFRNASLIRRSAE